MKNILVLTDFSENAKAAEKYALKLAIHVKGNLILYNVYSRKRQTVSGNVVWPHNAPPSLQLQSISNLQADVNELNDDLTKIKENIHKPEISHLGNSGSLTNKLNEIIRDNKVWLVIMGTRGESFASNVLFGSNVFKVLKKINCPLLITPENTEYKNLQKVAYATDFRSSDLKIVEWLYELVNALKIELSIVHVSSDTVTDLQNDTLKKQEKTYQSKFPKTIIKLHKGANIQHTLHEIIEQMGVDILALMHRKYRFFESLSHPSTSHKMVKHTKIPVLVFPDLQEE